MKNLLALSLLLPSLAYSATVKFSEELIPLQVNENKVEHSLFSTVTEVNVPAGKHKIKVKYKDLYEINYDEHELIESDPFWLVVNVADGTATYQISMPRADDIEGAKQYVAKPFAVLEELGSEQTKRLEPVKAHLVVSTEAADKKQTIANIESKNTPSGFITPPSEEVSNAQKQLNAPISQQPSALNMLEFWWSQASEQEKASFLANKKGS